MTKFASAFPSLREELARLREYERAVEEEQSRIARLAADGEVTDA